MPALQEPAGPLTKLERRHDALREAVVRALHALAPPNTEEKRKVAAALDELRLEYDDARKRDEKEEILKVIRALQEMSRPPKRLHLGNSRSEGKSPPKK